MDIEYMIILIIWYLQYSLTSWYMKINLLETDFRKGFRCTREQSLGAKWE